MAAQTMPDGSTWDPITGEVRPAGAPGPDPSMSGIGGTDEGWSYRDPASSLLERYGFGTGNLKGLDKSLFFPMRPGGTGDIAGLQTDQQYKTLIEPFYRQPSQQEMARLNDPHDPENNEGGSDLANILRVVASVYGASSAFGALGAGAAGSGGLSQVGGAGGLGDVMGTAGFNPGSAAGLEGMGEWGTYGSAGADLSAVGGAGGLGDVMGTAGFNPGSFSAASGLGADQFGGDFMSLDGGGGAMESLGAPVVEAGSVYNPASQTFTPSAGNVAASLTGSGGLGNLIGGTSWIGGAASALGGGGSLASLLMRAAPGLLGAYTSSKNTDKLRALADQYASYGAPSRARYEGSFAPGFTMGNDPGYTDALNQASKATLHGLSTQGNPADSPNAWAQSLKDNYERTAYPALQQYRNQNASTSGIGAFNAAAPGGSLAAIQNSGQTAANLGGAFNDAFNPKQSSVLGDILRMSQSGNIFKVGG